MLIDESHFCALKKQSWETEVNLRVPTLRTFHDARAVTLHFDFVHRTAAIMKSATLQIR